jgi:cytoskeleton-associated protein 5
METNGKAELVDTLLAGLKEKKPKIPPACVLCLTDALKKFGPKEMSLGKLVSALPGMMSASKKDLKDAGKALLLEIYRWVGPGMLDGCIQSLKTAQKSELEKAFETITPGTAVATFSQSKGSNGPNAPTDGAAAAPAVDLREFATEVDLVAVLSKTKYKSLVEHTKWSERVRGLQTVLDEIGSVPKLKGPAVNYADLCGTLKKLMTQDSNMQVVLKAIAVVGALADGLRKEFHMYGKGFVLELMQKWKDKKATVVTAVHAALDKLYKGSFALDQVMDDLKASADSKKNKNVALRTQVVVWLGHCVELAGTKVRTLSDGILKQVVNLLIKALDDPDGCVRSVATEGLASLLRHFPEHNAIAEMKKSHPKPLDKIKQIVSGGGQKAGKPKEPAKKKAPATKISDSTKTASTKTASKRSSVTKAAPETQKSEPEPLQQEATCTVNVEESLVKIKEMGVAEETCAALSAVKWQERMEAISAIQRCCEQADKCVDYAGPLLVVLREYTKQFKETNVNIMKAVFALFEYVASASSSSATLPRYVVAALIPPAVDKLGARNAKDGCSALLLALSEAVGPQFVLQTKYQHLATVKAPGVHVEALSWMSQCATEFGVKSFQTKPMLEHLKTPQGLNSSNVKVRTAAIAVLVALYQQLGPTLKDTLGDNIKPAQMSSIDKEFAKVTFDATASNKCARKVKAPEAAAEGASADKTRVDISADLKPLMKDMDASGDKNAWKLRNAALDGVQKLLKSAAGAIETKGCLELIRALKLRLKDSNANLKVKATQIIGQVGNSIGPKCAKLSKYIMEELVLCASDNKKTMRDAVIGTLTLWVSHDGATVGPCIESIIPYLPSAMAQAASGVQLLEWMQTHLSAVPSGSIQKNRNGGVEFLIAPTLKCLTDRATETRVQAELLLRALVLILGEETIEVELGRANIKPAVMRTLKPMIHAVYQKAKECGGAQQDLSTKSDEAEAAKDAIVEVDTTPKAATRTVGSPEAAAVPSRNRSGSSSGSSSSSSSSSSTAAEVAPHVDHQDALLLTSGKPKRSQSHKRKPWASSAEGVTDTHMEELKLAWAPSVSTELMTQLFATEHTTIVKALETLNVAVHALPDEVIANLDFLLKWTSLQLGHNNIQVLTATAKFLSKLFVMLEASNYQLMDFEAEIFLPFLVVAIGSNKARFREQFIELMKVVRRVYAANKFVPFVMEGLRSKNQRSRIECLNELARLVSNTGISVIGKKGLQEIVKLAGAPQKDIREAGVGVIMAVHIKMGSDSVKTLKVIGDCSDTLKKLIQSKMKDAAQQQPKEVQQQTPAASSRQAQHEELENMQYSVSPVLSLDDSDAEFQPSPLGASPTASGACMNTPSASSKMVAMDGSPDIEDHNPFQFNDESIVVESETPPLTVKMASKTHSLTADSDSKPSQAPTQALQDKFAVLLGRLDGLLSLYDDHLMGQSDEKVDTKDPLYGQGRDSLKILHMMMSNNHDGGNSPLASVMDQHANRLVEQVTTCVKCAFLERDKIDVNLLALALAVLYALLQTESIASVIEAAPLSALFEEVVDRLPDPRFADQNGPYVASAEKLIGAMNMVILQAVESVDPTTVFVSALKLLVRCVEKSGEDLGNKVVQLYVRLFLKVMKKELAASAPFASLDILQILSVLHTFFSAACTAGQCDESVFKAANTLLRHLAQDMDVSAVDAASSTFEASSPLHQLIQLHRQSDRTTKSLSAATTPQEATHATDMHEDERRENGSTPTTASLDELSQILQRLSGPASQEAIEELHQFKGVHPRIDVLAHLPPVSTAFKEYLKQQLRKLDGASTARKGGGTRADAEKKENTGPVDVIGDRLRSLQARLKIGTVEGAAPLSTASAVPTASVENISAEYPLKPKKSAAAMTAQTTNVAENKIQSSAGGVASSETGATTSLQALKDRLEKLRSK